jgi:hypothetical protein
MAEAIAEGIEAQPSTDLRRQSVAQAHCSLTENGRTPVIARALALKDDEAAR